jgi:hypothetical protein
MKNYKNGLHVINNNYQVESFNRIKNQAFSGVSMSRVVIGHNIDIGLKSTAEFWLQSPFSSKKWMSIYPIFKSKIEINKFLNSIEKAVDVVIIHSEFDPFVHMIINHFSTRGVDIVFIEDGAIATYVDNKRNKSDRLSIKDYLRYYFLWKLMLGLNEITPYKLRNKFYPRAYDTNITYFALPRDFKTERCIDVRKVEVISPHLTNTPRGFKPAVILFVGQPMYKDKKVALDYWRIVNSVFMKVMRNEDITIFYKPHPREKIAEVEKYLRRDQILDAQDGVIEKKHLIAACGFYSAMLLDLESEGVMPVFLYKLLFKTIDSTIRDIDLFLSEQNIRVIKQETELDSLIEKIKKI